MAEEDERYRLDQRIDHVTNQSVDATRRIRAVAEETNQMGVDTLITLNEQGEKLDNVERRLDDVNVDLKRTDRNLTRLEACCSCPCGPRSTQSTRTYKKAYGKKARQMEDVVSEQPRSGGGGGGQPQGPFIKRVTDDTREDEMEDNLQAVSNVLTNLKGIASDMGTELDRQNNQLDRINNKADANIVHLENTNRRIARQLRYATVERRAQVLAGKRYCAIPCDGELAVAVGSLSPLSGHLDQYSSSRDGCSRDHQYPVVELLDGRLWPVLLLAKHNLLFAAIPLVEFTGEDRPPLVQVAGISVSLALLELICEVLSPDDSQPIDETSSKLQELYQLLCVSAPLGTVLDSNIHSVRSQLQLSKSKPTPMPKQKQPAWRPMAVRGSGKLSVAIKEQIQAVQYDQPEISDCWEVFGTVQCKAELDGSPEILLTLSTPSDLPPLDPHLVVHPGVQLTSASSQLDSSGPTLQLRHRKIRFSAPGEQFTLCHYQMSGLSHLPIRGFYQMKGDTTVKILVQLKLNESVKNSFEFFDVQIPFFNRGPIDKVDNITPATVAASLALSEDRKAIIWTIGQKFPSKSLEVSLQATVHFHENPVLSSTDDPFCTRLNAYIDLFFKVTDFCLSGCNVEAKSLTLFPSARCKLLTSRELSSNSYRIWNSHGDAIVAQSQIKANIS